MVILFPESPLHVIGKPGTRLAVEPDFQNQWDAAQRAGFECAVIDVDFDGEILTLRKTLPEGEVLYRGWMLDAAGYRKFYDRLKKRGTNLLADPKAYSNAHLFPRYYKKIAGHTPPSIWTDLNDAQSDEWIEKVGKEFGDSPIVVRGFWKSEKHNWDKACFVPDATDKDKLRSTIRKFITYTGSPGGIVCRKYFKLELLEGGGRASSDGPPLSKEFRVFFLNGSILTWGPYWKEEVLKYNDAYYDTEKPPLDVIAELGKKIESPFFTMDVAKLEDGTWTVIEVGDGGVSDLQAIRPDEFYSNLAAKLKE